MYCLHLPIPSQTLLQVKYHLCWVVLSFYACLSQLTTIGTMKKTVKMHFAYHNLTLDDFFLQKWNIEQRCVFKGFRSVTIYFVCIILLTSSNNQISKFWIPNILFTCLINGETFCNLYIEITKPFLILSKSQRSLKMCSQNH